MKNTYEQVYPISAVVVPQNGNINALPQFGINLGNLIAIEAMNALIGRMDGGLFNYDEVADNACKYAEAMLRRMP
jgi:hypothetical protein